LLLPAFAGTGEGLLARGLSDVSITTRIDHLIQGGCAPFIGVLPDTMTSVGGSQYLDSPGIGAYQTYVADELPRFVADHASVSGKWGAVGRSSGGYGALRLALDRPGFLSAVACHAGDMGFALTYASDVRDAIRGFQSLGGLDGWVERFWALTRPSGHHFAAFNMLAMACAYEPDADRTPYPCRLPFDPESGAVDLSAFERWSRHDPLTLVEKEGAADALNRLDLLFLDAGESDEYGLHLSLRRFVSALTRQGVTHEHEEHLGGHRGTSWRYGISLPKVADALANA